MTDTGLRDRIAAALHDNLKRRTIQPTSDPFSGRIGGFGLTMNELADIALAVVQPELDRLAAIEAAAPDHAHDKTSRVMTVPVATLARKIAEKRDALAKLAEACREVDRLRAILDGDDMPLLCPDCVCADCGGTFEQHQPGSVCSCGCEPACDQFFRDSDLGTITKALSPLVGEPAAEVLAHPVWHALADAWEALSDGA